MIAPTAQWVVACFLALCSAKPHGRLEEMGPDDLEMVLARSPVAYVPLGSLEHHGWHLPVGFDGIKARALCERAAERTGGALLPTFFFGTGGGHIGYKWTLILPEDGIAGLIAATLDHLAGQGFRVIVILTGHYPGEQVAMVRRLASEAAARHPAARFIGVAESELATPEPGDPAAGDHAAKYETSIAMALRPEWVRIDRLTGGRDPDRAALPSTPRGSASTHDPLHPLYAIHGQDPRATASRILGERVVEEIVRRLAERVEEAMASASGSPAPADLILANGRIVTVDRAFSIAQAMAIRGDRIVAVGRDEEVLARRGSQTRIVDLQGACVLPGLIDSHCHPSAAAVAEIDHPRPPMDSIADVLAYIEGRAKVLPKGEWIFIGQRFITRLRERRYPTRAELDRVAPDHPVIFRTGPDCCVNSAALRAAGIGRDDIPVAKDAKAERDPATGELTGVFRNMTDVFSRHIRQVPISFPERVASLRKLLAAYNAVGLTSVGDRDARAHDVEAYEALRARGELTVRISIAHHLELAGGREGIDRQLQGIAALRAAREPDLWIRIRTVKGYVDGGMLTGSALMREPWGRSEIYDIADPAYRGLRFVPQDLLRLAVERARAHGFAFTAHCQGDGGSDALISAYEALDGIAPIRDCRMCVSHGSFQGLDLIRRATRIGVVVDSQPPWLFLDAAVLLEQFGRPRMRYFIPLRTWFQEGGIVAGGSDHMIGFDPDTSINPFNPFLGMWVAIARRARWVDGPVIPEEALTREQALRLYTINGAILEFAEEEKGSLEPGKLADFIVIDRDYLSCPVDEIRSIRVLRTYVGGKLVFERP